MRELDIREFGGVRRLHLGGVALVPRSGRLSSGVWSSFRGLVPSHPAGSLTLETVAVVADGAPAVSVTHDQLAGLVRRPSSRSFVEMAA